MDLPELFILSDPVLLRIFFDRRRFAPRTWPRDNPGAVTCLEMDIAETKVEFLKVKTEQRAEILAGRMRRDWFAIRELCDGYYMELPACYSDGCQHVIGFRYDNAAPVFNVDKRKRRAIWAGSQDT